MVANGHHWDPRWPEPAFPGHDVFEGEQMHAHFYREPDTLRGKRVVVLGMGNSAMDLAVDASYLADAVYLAARRGAHVLPKYIFGKPIGPARRLPKMPFAIRGRIFQTLLKFYVGDVETTACPSPTTSSARRTRRSRAASSTGSPTGRSSRSPTSAS